MGKLHITNFLQIHGRMLRGRCSRVAGVDENMGSSGSDHCQSQGSIILCYLSFWFWKDLTVPEASRKFWKNKLQILKGCCWMLFGPEYHRIESTHKNKEI